MCSSKSFGGRWGEKSWLVICSAYDSTSFVFPKPSLSWGTDRDWRFPNFFVRLESLDWPTMCHDTRFLRDAQEMQERHFGDIMLEPETINEYIKGLERQRRNFFIDKKTEVIARQTTWEWQNRIIREHSEPTQNLFPSISVGQHSVSFRNFSAGSQFHFR